MQHETRHPAPENAGTTIRPARLDDLDAIAHLDAAVFGAGAYPRFFFRQMHDLFGALLQVAVVEGGVAGYALGALAAGSAEGWILSTAVHPAERGRGLARRLVERVAAVLAARGADEVRLTVEPENAAAIARYRRLGFEVVDEEADYFGAGARRLVMARAV
jgi:ribosomal protein S18 acetylase RimI-like enzyme